MIERVSSWQVEGTFPFNSPRHVFGQNCVYALYDASDEVTYIGRSEHNVHRRLRTHGRTGHGYTRFVVFELASASEMVEAERQLIMDMRPRNNVEVYS